MGKSMAEQAARRTFRFRLKKNPDYAQVWSDYLFKMESGFFQDIDFFGQTPSGGFTLEDAMVFADLWTWFCTGEILHAKIQVGQEPYADRQAKSNNQILAQLPSPFVAKFVGGPGDSDGWLAWTEPIEVGVIRPDDGVEVRLTLGPRQVPLEVGYTRFCTTKLHLFSSRGLARWPYGSEWICLLWFSAWEKYHLKLPF